MVLSSEFHVGDDARRLAIRMVSEIVRPFDSVLQLPASIWISVVESFDENAHASPDSSLACTSSIKGDYTVHDFLDFVLNLDDLELVSEDMVWFVIKRISLSLHKVSEDSEIMSLLQMPQELMRAVRKTIEMHEGNFRPLLVWLFLPFFFLLSSIFLYSVLMRRFVCILFGWFL